MKILHKIRPIEVKRAFVISQKMRFSRRKGKKYLPKLTEAEFLKKLKQAKTITNKLTERQLDKIIADEYRKRADAYNNADWYRATVTTKEVGVWRRAGGLPPQWTCCSLSQTALRVKKGLKRNSKRIRARSKRAIPRIMEFADVISREKCLSPIVFAGGTGTCGRKWCRKKMKGDVDDGCMRSIALALSGRKTLNVYFGKPKKKP
ncbi:MAG: hypothetical protein A3G49_00425 [Candidatus Sungbacteria bacterium RIFCSPLOWO2_12_FULL_41_11]|uniref:Uncharacterized protein n=1 Tax=Candidatus Sungbacteria bacterium RIFCSPLOWO2_12_FULL_41_11 TaxID=1802286 RepID=A0A1G2LML9_9BACT|nr:MAG: hypothetical protein UV01_C0002G0112 [Parcubacteria group bacterium GW2011_GWA2_42_14]OHA12774.1 MAG: hypothetical protein A3G49_00425 [Candidatus Sungbacteria bacterium RIFCSPLOWO2_12_FULL_41_11]